MTASKAGRQVALPDSDPSVASAQTARVELESQSLARYPTDDRIIEQAKKKRAAFIVALLRHFAARLKSFFRASAHSPTSNPFDA